MVDRFRLFGPVEVHGPAGWARGDRMRLAMAELNGGLAARDVGDLVAAQARLESAGRGEAEGAVTGVRLAPARFRGT